MKKLFLTFSILLVMLFNCSFGVYASAVSGGNAYSREHEAIDSLVSESIALSEENLESGDRAVSVNGSKELTYFLSVKDKSIYSHKKISVTLAGEKIPEVAYLINETTYIPLRAALTLAGAEISFDDATRTAYVSMAGLNLSVKDGSYVAVANGRPLLTATPSVILSDGRMYIPNRSLAKTLGLSVEWQPPAAVELSGKISPLPSSDQYYNSDDLSWLSKIISAEARGESLIGQIAVGNIVLNRMRSRDYPNTIYGVIFDKKHGIQFSPVRDGTIYREPTYSAIQAAKICLEGVSVSPDILFFLNPTASSSSWIVLNRKYAFTIGNHYFFY